MQEDILTFLHFFLESPSLRPRKRTDPAENSAGPFLVPPASPGNGRSGSRRTAALPQKQLSEPEFQDKAYLHRAQKTR